MITKIYKIIFFCFIILHQNFSYSKNLDTTKFEKKNVYNYFSGLISLNNNENLKSLKFFNSSKKLKDNHQSYIKSYLISLVRNEKINRAIVEIKSTKNKKFINFFEAKLLLAIDSMKNEDYERSLLYLQDMKISSTEGSFENIISNVLEGYVYLFQYNQINQNFNQNYGNLSLINKTLQSCYLDKSNTTNLFKNVINTEDKGYSRYSFFYINYLISKKKFDEVQNISKNIDPLISSLLVTQTKELVNKKNFKYIEEIFSCKNSNNVISEFFFIISNLYSSEGYLNKSNFYFNLSNYLNPKFKFNLSLLAENFFQQEEYGKVKKVLKNFNKKNEVYHWYRIKKKAEIINKENNIEESFNYIESEFNKIQNPSLKIIYDMANVTKSFEKYDLSIQFYSQILTKLDSKSKIYADILYRRGASYERLGNNKKSDEDMLKSLEIIPDQPRVLNYLAYSWLERNYKINKAIKMLESAYKQRKNDPYIIDSIGWAYYLTGDYVRAEKLLKKAIEIMPHDPIVNDHYGDILWKLDRKIEAGYYWKNVLTFTDTEPKMKEEIYLKLLKGLKKV